MDLKSEELFVCMCKMSDGTILFHGPYPSVEEASRVVSGTARYYEPSGAAPPPTWVVRMDAVKIWPPPYTKSEDSSEVKEVT